MLDVNKGSAVWAGQFDEKFSDVLALEDAISEQVAEALISQVTGESNIKLGERGTDNAEAYEAYLKGRFYWNQFTADSLPKAIVQFQKAVEITGVIMTKMDGTAKGGAALSVVQSLQKPIMLIGVGEKINDLRIFNWRDYVSGVLGLQKDNVL